MPVVAITDEDRQRIDKKFICTLCKNLLCNPMQTTCGHLMCRSCIESLLENSNPKCPEDGKELGKENVFPDAFAKRELRGLRLHCANPGCSQISTYEKLEGHSQVCEHTLIKCVHSQCQTKVKRSQLGEHLKSECEYRNVKCDYCGKDVVHALLKEHLGTSCENAPVACRYCKEHVGRKDIEKHESESCEAVPAICEFHAVGCNSKKRLTLTELQEYTERESVGHEKFVMLVGKLTGLERRIETLESSGGGDARLKNEVTEMKMKVRDLTAECSNLRERNMSLERQLTEKTSIIERLQSRLDQIDESLDLNTVKINDIESQRDSRSKQGNIYSYDGTLLWKIEDYQRKRQDAINGVNTALYSPTFYSAQFGYKMCAKIHMNGDGIGEGSHLSLFFVLMRGDYDALQTWPCQKKITMMLLDQGNGGHMNDVIKTFHSDLQSSSFQRPKSEMNIASGSPLFMPLDGLNNRQYIKDDVMFIKVIVE